MPAKKKRIREAAKPPAVPKKEKLGIDYIKSNFFRVIHADGVWGGMTNQGYIHMDFWSERQPIPQRIVYKLIENGLGDELRELREQRQDVIREVEVGVVMDVATARMFRKWLDEKIEFAEKQLSKLSALPPAMPSEKNH